MRRMLAAEPAVLFCFKLIRVLFLVLQRGVIPVLAYRAFEAYDFAHIFITVVCTA